MATASTGSSPKGARILGEARAELAEQIRVRYEAGESIRSIAGDLGRSYGFVQGLLKEVGVSLRGRGGATRGRAAAERREAIREAVAEARAAAEGDGHRPGTDLPE